MRTAIRIIISIIAGFFLMWPLGYICGLLNLPTFHSWALLHGGFFSAWPTLSILTYLALGYIPALPRTEDTPFLIAGLIWGLVLEGFLGIGSYLNPAILYAVLSVTTAVIAALGFFAKRSLRLALLTMSPVLFMELGILPVLISQPTFNTISIEATFLIYHLKKPLLAALVGWALARLARVAAVRLQKGAPSERLS